MLSLIIRFNHMIKSTAQTTKQQIARAALEALRTEGFAGATSRAIGRIGGFNQALIFYHFGTPREPAARGARPDRARSA